MFNYTYLNVYQPYKQFRAFRKKYKSVVIEPEHNMKYFKAIALGQLNFWYKLVPTYYEYYIYSEMSTSDFLKEQVRNTLPPKKSQVTPQNAESGDQPQNAEEFKEGDEITFDDIERMLDTLRATDPEKFKEVTQRGKNLIIPENPPLKK